MSSILNAKIASLAAACHLLSLSQWTIAQTDTPHNMADMPSMEMGPMQGGKPPPDARDPNAYAEGAEHKHLGGMDMADNKWFGNLVVNKLEYNDARSEYGQTLDAEAWYGADYDKLWLKAEGERHDRRLDALRTEALWDRAFDAFWSTQLGARQDTGQGESRHWLAFGVQGLAPYWFETEATFYWGKGGVFSALLDFKYELLITQRWILQPNLEANFFSESDADIGIGKGLSDLELGLRLRYEITRHFAPYIGISTKREFGDTADFSQAVDENTRLTEAVAGIRLWL